MVGDPIRLQEIFAKNASWTPYKPGEHPFRDLTDEQIKSRFGLREH